MAVLEMAGRQKGPGKRRGEVVVMESPVGGVYAKTRGNRIYLRAYRNDGDKVGELELAASAARLMTGVPFEVIGVRLQDDHP